MRLREIEIHLNKSLELLQTYSVTQAPNTHPPRLSIYPLNAVREALALINRTGLFREEYEVLSKSSIGNNILNSIQVTNEEVHTITSTVNSLITKIFTVLESIKIALPKAGNDDTVIYIKLPELQDFDDLSKFIDQLKKAIQIPITLEGIGGQVLITNFDSGSRWFEIVVKTSIAASLVGSLAWAGAVISKKYQEARLVEEHVKRAQLGTQHLEALVEANNKQINLFIEAEAAYIHGEYFKNSKDKHEDLERLKLSIKTMSTIIDKGAEIQPALLSPESVSNLFPNYANLMLIESKQKLIDKE